MLVVASLKKKERATHTRNFVFVLSTFDELIVADIFDGYFGADFFVHVVEDDGLNGYHLAANDRIGQIQLDEKRPEDLKL